LPIVVAMRLITQLNVRHEHQKKRELNTKIQLTEKVIYDIADPSS